MAGGAWDSWAQSADPVHSECLLFFNRGGLSSLTLVRSFLAFSSLSISIFWALAKEKKGCYEGPRSSCPLTALSLEFFWCVFCR